MLKRYLLDEIISDLKEKMVFLGGPRQVGKTTFARKIIGSQYTNPAYYNWDFRADRKDLISSLFPPLTDLLVLDEVHKYKKWKTLVKGLYDKHKEDYKIIVTGSARLDIYRRGGDSLQGRYHYYRLHPLSVAEIQNKKNNAKIFAPLDFESSKGSHETLNNLAVYGGFPESFVAQNEKRTRRWQNERTERLVREDIRDVEAVRDLGSMELLSSMLQEKASGLLSINSLREDLEVSHKAVSHWVDLLERFYYIFRIYPFAGKKIRSLKKEPKLYLWDWSEVKDMPKRYENIIASHLLKFVHYLHDAEGHNADLLFLRDKEGREVDFLVTIDQKPWFAVEVKTQDTNISKNLLYFEERLKIPYLYQVVFDKSIDKQNGKVRIISADKFLSGLI